MKPRIDGTRFGAITVAGEDFPHDVVIRLDGTVEILPTPQAVEAWNAAEGAVIGVFHVTC